MAPPKRHRTTNRHSRRTVKTSFGRAPSPTADPVRRRGQAPGVVAAASFLLGGLAAFRLMAALGAFYALPEFGRYHGTLQGDARAGQLAALGVLVFAGLSLVAAAVLLALAFLDHLGFHWARTATWIACGLAICGSIPMAVVDGYDAAPWYGRLTAIVTGATLTLAAAVMTLLALPASSAYFGSGRRTSTASPVTTGPRARDRRPSATPSRRIVGAALAAATLTVVLVVTSSTAPTPGGGVAVAPSAPPTASRHVEPPHEVVYWFTTTAPQRERIQISYVDGGGRVQSLTWAGELTGWAEVLRLPSGASGLELSARSGAAGAPPIRCRIQIDGRVVRESEGNPCHVRLTFPLASPTR